MACASVAVIAATQGSATPSAGRILFDGTWEGATPTSPWTGINVSYNGGNYAFLADPSRRGTVARVTLPPGGQAAIEAIHHRILRLGDATVYGLAFKFPRDWPRPKGGWGCVIAQLGYPLLKYTNIGLGLGWDYVGLEMHTGRIDWQGRTPSADNPATFDFRLSHRDGRGHAIPRNRFKTDVWHLLVIEVTWATGPTGSLRAWHQMQGEATWTRTVDLRGIPTMQWGYGISGGYMNAEGRDGRGRPKTISDKVGAYRYGSSQPLTIYNDGMLIGSTRQAVAARLQATPFRPTLAGPQPPVAHKGERFGFRFPVTGGVQPFRWSLLRGELPRGLRLNTARGTLDGMPRAPGRFRFTIGLRDDAGARASRTFSLRVLP